MPNPMDESDVWAKIAQYLDPYQAPESLVELLDGVPETKGSHVYYLGYGPYSEADMSIVRENFPLIGEFYDESFLLSVAEILQEEDARLAVLVNASFPLEDFISWAKNLNYSMDDHRFIGDTLYWRCNPMAASTDSIAWLRRELRLASDFPLLRWYRALSEHFSVNLDLHEALPLLVHACGRIASKWFSLNPDTAASPNKFGSTPLSSLFMAMIHQPIASGDHELSALAGMISSLNEINEKLGGPPMPNPFDRIL